VRFSLCACAIVQGIERLTMVKSSISSIVLGSLLGCLPLMISVARAAERGPVTVDQAPGVDLPPQLAADVRAVIEDALAGRTPPEVPIDVTLEAGGAAVRVGSLSRRIAIARWDYPAMRTVALHVLDLLQPAPETPEVAPDGAAADPTPRLVAKASPNARAAEDAGEPAAPWSLHAGVAGARGVQDPDPWIVSVAAGATWTHHEWLRIGLELGWDHSIVRHKDGITVNYDATPLRLVLAAQNSKLAAGVRAGVAPYRVTGEQPYREVSPVVGPFIAAPVPIVGRYRGLLVAGFDYFGRRTEILRSTFDLVYSTPQLAPYLGVIVEADLRP
jgi:hypothetical protein